MKISLKWTIFSLSASLIFWGFYLKWLSPTVNLKDSGELITAAFTLGIAHPPGYPLYALTAHLFSLLPLGEIAFRLNLFSAFWGVIDLILGALIIKKLGKEKLGIIAIALVGISPVFLTVALVTEVYTLEIALLLLTVYWLLSFQNYRLPLLILSLLLVLHPKNLLYGLPLLFYFLYVYRFTFSKRWLMALFIAILTMSIYLYLPQRAKQNPPLNWNQPVNLKRVIFHLSGQEYSGRILKPSYQQIHLFQDNFYQVFQETFTWPLLLLALVSIICLAYFRHFGELSIFLSLFLLNVFFGLVALDPVEGFMAHFYLPALFMTAILIGLALRYLPELITGIWLKTQRQSFLKFIILLIIIGGFLSRLFLVWQKDSLSQRRNFLTFDFACNQIKCLQPQTVLFAVGTRMIFPLQYVLYALEPRSDVLMIEGGFLKPIYLKWYLPALHLPAYFLSLNPNHIHHHLINYFFPKRPLYFAPLYSTGYSPLEFRLLPDKTRFFNYSLASWLIPASAVSETEIILKRIAGEKFSLRSYLHPVYQPSAYELYIFRKYNQFFSRD